MRAVIHLGRRLGRILGVLSITFFGAAHSEPATQSALAPLGHSAAYSDFVRDLVDFNNVLEDLRRRYLLQRCAPTEQTLGKIPSDLVKKAHHIVGDGESAERRAKSVAFTHEIILMWANLDPRLKTEAALQLLHSVAGQRLVRAVELKNSFALLENNLVDARSGELQSWPVGVWMRYLKASGNLQNVITLFTEAEINWTSLAWSDDPAERMTNAEAEMLKATAEIRVLLAERAFSRLATPEVVALSNQLENIGYFRFMEKVRALEKRVAVQRSLAAMRPGVQSFSFKQLVSDECLRWSGVSCAEDVVELLSSRYEAREGMTAFLPAPLNSVCSQ